MKTLSVFLLLFVLTSTELKAVEANWETLKTLTIDEKTKKAVTPPELQKILGKEIIIKGFMMPLDYESKEVTEFLLMPYVPACMHVPAPPANQLILVKMKKGSKIKPSFHPIELKGKLAVDSNIELESSYQMEGLKVTELKQYTPPAPAATTPGKHP